MEEQAHQPTPIPALLPPLAQLAHDAQGIANELELWEREWDVEARDSEIVASRRNVVWHARVLCGRAMKDLHEAAGTLHMLISLSPEQLETMLGSASHDH